MLNLFRHEKGKSKIVDFHLGSTTGKLQIDDTKSNVLLSYLMSQVNKIKNTRTLNNKKVISTGMMYLKSLNLKRLSL